MALATSFENSAPHANPSTSPAPEASRNDVTPALPPPSEALTEAAVAKLSGRAQRLNAIVTETELVLKRTEERLARMEAAMQRTGVKQKEADAMLVEWETENAALSDRLGEMTESFQEFDESASPVAEDEGPDSEVAPSSA